MAVSPINKVLNDIRDNTISYAVITDAYTELFDLQDSRNYNNIVLSSTLDEAVMLKFGNSELLVDKNQTVSLESFYHNGLVQIKYTSIAPTEGTFRMINW
jgi:hypothetical protein